MGRLRPGIWLLDRILTADPRSSVARMDEAALRQAQAATLPERGVASLLLGRPRRGVTIRTGGFVASHGERLPLRIYTPPGPARDRPVVVNYHGGGFALGSARIGDWMSSVVAVDLDAVVISVDYRLAPTHKFPAAVEDCYETLTWVAEHASEFGGDPRRLAVMGESAGGNLATVVAIKARDDGGPAIAHQTLLYPVTDLSEALRETPSYRDQTRELVVSRADSEAFHGHYLPAGVDTRDWRLSPLYAPDLSGLPPAAVVVAGLDMLHDCGVAYAKALAAAGVRVDLADYPQMPHGFLNFPYFSKAARPAMAAVVASQRAALS